MYGKTLKYLLTNPIEAIAASKKKKDMNTVIALMITEWVFFTIAVAVLVQNSALLVATFIGGIIATLFAGFLTEIVFRTLGGKGQYYEGLTTVVYSEIPLSFGLMISSFFLLGKYVGVVIALFVASIYSVMALATTYKAAKELFKIDMITTWVGIGVLIGGILIALYAVSIGYLGIIRPMPFSSLPSFTSMLLKP